MKKELLLVFEPGLELLVIGNSLADRLDNSGYKVEKLDVAGNSIKMYMTESLSIDDSIRIFHIFEKENFKAQSFSFDSYTEGAPVTYHF